jgi:hypothetical protein
MKGSNKPKIVEEQDEQMDDEDQVNTPIKELKVIKF